MFIKYHNGNQSYKRGLIQMASIAIWAILLWGCAPSPAIETDFFNKKDLTGWKAHDTRYWSVVDGAIVGKSSDQIENNQFLWSDIKVKDFYLSVDVKLDSANRNAGIQFRSHRQEDNGHATGYQADVGLNYETSVWGTIYYENGRGLLHASDPQSSTVKDGQWNRYEILASGNRIWVAINGKIISAMQDSGGDQEGYIALQIHSGPAQTVHYRINQLIHDPQITLAGKNESALNHLVRKPLVPVPGEHAINLRSGDIVGFTGGTNTANTLNDGYLETLLTSFFKTESIKFRNLGWEGDNVFEQFRDVGFGDWQTNIDSLKITTVFVQFGQMEILEGEERLPAFLEAYRNLLDTLRQTGKQVIILSPNDFEPESLKIIGDSSSKNPLSQTAIRKYFNAIQYMAQQEGYPFVDLYYPLMDNRKLTYDGVHLNEQGQRAAAEIIMKSLGMENPFTEKMEPLRARILAKNKLWFEYWRPGNWAFLRGDRTEPAFSRHWKDYSNRIFPSEVAKYGPLIVSEETKINDLANGKTIKADKEIKEDFIKTPAEDYTLAEERASFVLDKNYNIELFASETLGIAEPTAMRWDEKGRLWVLCIPTYPQPLPGQPANDRLIVLEDTNKDGRADVSTIFADNLNIPLGFELGHGGVYLGEQTRLLLLKDTNNDLRCDTREVLFSGFGTHDSHQTINSFTWSPGGELFFSHGLSIHSFVETAYGLKKAHRASIWRFRPHLSQLDNIIDQNGASENPWGITFGDWGEMFSKSNDTGVFFTSPALVLSNLKSFVPEIGGTHIKSGIVEIPRSSHLPQDIRNDLIIAGYYNNKVERMKMIEDGAGFKARLIEPLLSSTGKNFRPVDIKTGPDGALYILDWYNPIIGHYQASLRDPDRDKVHGRVWRITAKNRPLSSHPDLAKKSISELFNELSSTEYWVRYQTRRLVFSKSASEVIPALNKWVEEINVSDDKNLMAALTVYENFETVNTDLLQKALRSRHHGSRAYALQVVARWANRLNDPLKMVTPFLHDSHPRVRMMAIVACGNIKTPESMNTVVEVLRYPMDKFTRFAFERTVHALRDVWEPLFRRDSLNFSSNIHTATVISILSPDWYTADQYRKLLRSGNYSFDVKTKLLSALARVGANEDLEFILMQPFAQNNIFIIDELRKKKVTGITQGTVKAISKMLASGQNEAVVVAVMKLVSSWDIRQLSGQVKERMSASASSDKIIANGITTLVRLKDEDVLSLLERFISHPAKSVRLACISGYAKQEVKRGASEALKEINNGSGDVNGLRETVSVLVIEPGGVGALANEIKNSGLNSTLVQPALIAVDQLHIEDQELLAAIKKFEKKGNYLVPRHYDESFVSGLTKKVKSSGLASKGLQVYNMLNCGSCHAINGTGGNIGPNLSAVGSGLSTDDIITEVVWPNKNIKEGYGSVRLELTKGEFIQGIKVLETASTISVKATPAAAPVTYQKINLLSITPIGSAMPEGLAGSLNEEELRDLIKYLTELRDR